MDRYVCIHGHFYQPPRENPWLEAIEPQDSAHPYHDWNERITSECYSPNATSRILDDQGRIVQIVNNYVKISFDFGPTLLSWLQDKEYSKEVTDPEKEPGIKRYTLTEKGTAMLEEHVKRRRELRKRTGFFPSPFMGPPWIPHITEETSGLLEAGKRLAMSSWALLDNLHENHSEDVVAKATEVLTDAAKQIEEMTKELNDQKDN